MKIRLGFVSNSSSSSFIILTTIENHNKVLTQMTEKEINIIGKIMNNKKNIFGKELIYGNVINGNYSSLEYIIDELKEKEIEEDGVIVGKINNYDVYENVYNAWDKYTKMVRENADEVFTHREDF